MKHWRSWISHYWAPAETPHTFSTPRLHARPSPPSPPLSPPPFLAAPARSDPRSGTAVASSESTIAPVPGLAVSPLPSSPSDRHTPASVGTAASPPPPAPIAPPRRKLSSVVRSAAVASHRFAPSTGSCPRERPPTSRWLTSPSPVAAARPSWRHRVSSLATRPTVAPGPTLPPAHSAPDSPLAQEAPVEARSRGGGASRGGVGVRRTTGDTSLGPVSRECPPKLPLRSRPRSLPSLPEWGEALGACCASPARPAPEESLAAGGRPARELPRGRVPRELPRPRGWNGLAEATRDVGRWAGLWPAEGAVRVGVWASSPSLAPGSGPPRPVLGTAGLTSTCGARE